MNRGSRSRTAISTSKRISKVEQKPQIEQPQVTASLAILELATSLATTSEQISDKVSDILKPVMVPDIGSTGLTSYSVEQPFPPLFEALRQQLLRLSLALQTIDDCLNRTEL